MPGTIFAHSSGQPPAAIAIIRISGPEAFAAGEALAGSLPPLRTAGVRSLRDGAGGLLDEALVLTFAAPASATGEDLVELHCHGGRAVIAAILAALRALPLLREAEPGEFTRRALGNGRIDLTEAEGLADLLEAETEQQRRAALANSGGALRRVVEDWRNRILALSAQAEAAIDYVGDEEETAVDLQSLREEAAHLAAEWRAHLEAPRMEVLKQGFRVVLAGPPNSGKSSLLNALVGEDRAIVTDIAGTTRDLVEVPVAIAGIPYVFVDTAGLRQSEDVVERIGVDLAQRAVESADIVLWLGDHQAAPIHAAFLLVYAQADRRGVGPEGTLAVSATTGHGVEELKAAIADKAVTLLPNQRDLVLNARQATELDNAEQVIRSLTDDLVLVAERFRAAREALDRISGRAGIEDMLDGLFGRFCLGK